MAKRERAAPVVHDDGFTINGCAFHVDTKYQPLDAIGQGSYGVVCSVRDADTGEKLAIKKITPMAGDEWDATHTLREIRLMRCLGAHENIISLKDLSMCQEKDELYMMMELADTDLHRLIQSSCPLTEGHIRVIMFQLLSGVKAMHDNGVLHRDLKPGNLLLNKDCELKITDFGLARMTPKEHQSNDDGSGDARAAAPNAVVSPMTEYVVTRWYRPPELMLAPNGCYDGAVDMWSVGCILGELIARKPMFPGTDFMDQLTRVFKVISIPDKDSRGYYIEKDALKFLSSLPPAPPNALEKLARSAGPHASDLIQRLLCFNPKQRMSVDEALAHPFFDGVKDEWGEIAPLALGHSLEFAFETQSLPLATLRQYICDEVLAFRKKDETQRLAKQAATAADPADEFDAHSRDKHDAGGNEHEKVKERAPEQRASSSSNNNQPLKLENDWKPGSGFTIKGCEFNVPPQYKALQVLGEGSYGIVCAAADGTTKKNVAIKKITPMAGDEWDAKHTLREIRLMRYFGQHPNIASLQNLSTCAEKDELYIMMDLVDTDLHRLIQSKTKLEDAHVAAIMYQLLCGAKTLHENGVLHRDLKPGNILVSKNCDVKITDFGLSRYIPQGGAAGGGGVSATGLDKGKELMTEYVVTRWYRPPEIMLAPNGCYNESVDMWSIGCIFGELLNRRPLFPGTDFIDQLTKVFSVLPVPSSDDKRGYAVEGDALKFLESLPPCSPSAMTKAFRKASPEAVSLLRRLLCVNPERRITAKQALAHPYFKGIRQQLGEPPEFQVAKAFDFDFDNRDLPLSRLKQLIQEEVKLLQQDQQDPSTSSSAPLVSTKPAGASTSSASERDPSKSQQPQEHSKDRGNNADDSKHPNSLLKRDESSPATQPGSDGLSDDDDEDFERAMLREPLDAKKLSSATISVAAAGPPIAPKEFLAKQNASPSVDDDASRRTTGDGKQRIDESRRKDRDEMPETDEGDSESEYGKREHQQSQHSKQQQQQPGVDSDDEEHEIIQVERTRGPVARATSGVSKLERPKSAVGAHRATASRADPRDEDQHHSHRQSSSRLSNNGSSNSGNNSHDSERWGQPRASTTASRIHHPVYGATMSTTNDRRAKLATSSRSSNATTTATASSNHGSSSSRNSSNQHSARDSEKSDAMRHPERISISTTASSSRSSHTTKTTPTSSKTTPTSSRTNVTPKASSSSSKDAALPDGWIKKTHSKSGREYYYDTLHKVSSWKHPAKALENIFGTTRVPSASSSSNNSKAATPTSADSVTPTSSKIVTAGRRTLLSGSSAAAALPKDWARRTDPKSGRLFYVNLLTNKSFAKLPSSVVAAMAASKESGGVASSSSASNLAATAAKKSGGDMLRKKSTVPQSPQFSQMSWQRKRVPGTDE